MSHLFKGLQIGVFSLLVLVGSVHPPVLYLQLAQGNAAFLYGNHISLPFLIISQQSSDSSGANTCKSDFEEGGLTFLSAIWTAARLPAAQTHTHSSDWALFTQTFPILSERAAAELAALQAL